jgi:hypothetical protein
MKIFRMKHLFSKQLWYSNEVFTLVKINHERKISMFGVDCEWKNIKTGEVINNWNTVFEEITKQEKRDVIIESLKWI